MVKQGNDERNAMLAPGARFGFILFLFPVPTSVFFRQTRMNLTRGWYLVLVLFVGRMEGTAHAQEFALWAGPLYGNGKEPTGWGHRAYGMGLGAGLRFTNTRTMLPVLAEVQASQFVGRQPSLDALQYQGQSMGAVQRFGLSFSDVEFFTVSGKLLYMPVLFQDSGSVVMRLRFGLLAGQTTTAWLHPVTITRVYTLRPFVGPSVGVAFTSYGHGRFGFSYSADLSPCMLTSAKRSTNEGRSYVEQPWRFTGPGNTFSISSSFSVGYQIGKRFSADLTLLFASQTLGRGGVADWNQAALVAGVRYTLQ